MAAVEASRTGAGVVGGAEGVGSTTGVDVAAGAGGELRAAARALVASSSRPAARSPLTKLFVPPSSYHSPKRIDATLSPFLDSLHNLTATTHTRFRYDYRLASCS